MLETPLRRLPQVAALVPLLLACGAPPEPEPPPPPRHNLLLILVDTLRADHLGSYGYPRNTSPNLDRFARRNLQFLDARSQAACTFPSVNSLLTSRYPDVFLSAPDPYFGIPQGIPSLAQMLQSAGYATAAVSASPIVRATPSEHNPDGGFGSGFDRFFEECQWRTGHCIQRRARELLTAWAAEADSPFFLFLHYMEPHGPYQPPPTFERRFTRTQSAPDWVLKGDPNPIARHLYRGEVDPGISKKNLAHLIDLYDDEIAFLDLLFGRLLRILAELELADSILIVVASDHGEEFLEHGHIKHCRTLYDTSTWTPLLMRIPGVDRPAALPGVAENLDIVPTVLDYLGIEPPAGLEGRSLRPQIENRLPTQRYAYSLQNNLYSVNNSRFKLVADVARGEVMLLDRIADPAEVENRLREGGSPPPHVRRRLVAWLERAAGRKDGESGPRGGERAQERLRALGYLQ